MSFSISVLETGESKLYFIIPSREYSFSNLVFLNIYSRVIFEITASVLAIIAFVKFASYVPEINLDEVSSLSPSLYIIYVAAALTGIRVSHDIPEVNTLNRK